MATKAKEPQPIRPQNLPHATRHYSPDESWVRLIDAFNPKKQKFSEVYERYPGYFNDEEKENKDLLYGKDMAPYFHLNTGNWHFVKILDNKKSTEKVLVEELSALHRVGEHPNISSIMGIFEEPEKRYIAYSMNGEPYSRIFEEVSDSMRLIRFDVVNEIARELLDVLSFIHSKGIVHRNIGQKTVYSKYNPVFIPICLTHINPALTEGEHVLDPAVPKPLVELSPGMAPETIQELLHKNFNEKVYPAHSKTDSQFQRDAKRDVYAAGAFLYDLCLMRPMIGKTGCVEHSYMAVATCSKCLHKRLLNQTDNMTYLWNKYEIRSSRLPAMLKEVVQACLEPLAAERKQVNEILTKYDLLDNKYRERLAKHCNDRAVHGHSWVDCTLVTGFSDEQPDDDDDDVFEDPEKTPRPINQMRWVRTSPGSPMWQTHYAHSTPKHPEAAALAETWEVMDCEDHYQKLTGDDVDVKKYMTCIDAYIRVEREDAHLDSPELPPKKPVAQVLSYTEADDDDDDVFA